MTAPQPNVLAGSVTQTTVPADQWASRGSRDRTAGRRIPGRAAPSSSAGLPGVVVYQRVVTPDEKIRYTYISEGARDIFGVSPAEIFRIPRRCSVATAMNTRQGSEERPLALRKPSPPGTSKPPSSPATAARNTLTRSPGPSASRMVRCCGPGSSWTKPAPARRWSRSLAGLSAVWRG